MPANANPSPRRLANDLTNSPGYIGAAARFWQVRTALASTVQSADRVEQRSYASDYLGLAILITGYVLVRVL